MISPLEVYLVMQLDAIISGLFVIIGFAVFTIGAIALAIALERDDTSSTNPEYLQLVARHRKLGKLACAMAALIIVANLIPSSRTAATMIVLPAVTSREVAEVVGPEAKELYNLAKDALRSLGTKGEK